MAKANDKKVARQARELLLRTLGNLLESHRERKFTHPHTGKPLSRAVFCAQKNLGAPNVAYIETGRFLALNFNQFRIYLATVYGRNNIAFVTKVRKVYDGLKELDDLLKQL